MTLNIPGVRVPGALAAIALTVSFLGTAHAGTQPDWPADLSFYRQEVFEPDNSYSEDERARAEQLLVHASNAPPESMPVYLQEPATAFRHLRLESLQASYIQFKANIDYSGQQDINAFVDLAAEALRRAPPGHIIVDQRFNYGGDLNTTRELMQKLPDYLGPDGKLFLVTSGRTFSASISSVGYAAQAAGERAVIVGEPVGDALEFWAEGDLKILPNSGVAFLMATERHNYVTGCPESDCHGSIRRNPIRVRSLEPDIPAPLSHAAFQNGSDPALDAISKRIHAGDG